MLLSVLSANLENPAGRRLARAQLHAIGQSGRDFLSLIHSPEQSTITLTSSEANIPLTFRNDTDKIVPIHIALTSDKLRVPRRHRPRRHARTREEPDGADRGRDPELGHLSRC